MPETLQDKDAAAPAVIEEGEAVKEAMDGGVEVGKTTVLLTVTVVWAVAVPPEPVAVRV